jgi:hypothetical protein
MLGFHKAQILIRAATVHQASRAGEKQACLLACWGRGEARRGEWEPAFLFSFFLVLFSKEMIPLLAGYFIVGNRKNLYLPLSTRFCKGLMIPLLTGYFIVGNPKTLPASLYMFL